MSSCVHCFCAVPCDTQTQKRSGVASAHTVCPCALESKLASCVLLIESLRGPHVNTMAEACHMLSRMLSMRISWRSVWWQACPACPVHTQ